MGELEVQKRKNYENGYTTKHTGKNSAPYKFPKFTLAIIIKEFTYVKAFVQIMDIAEQFNCLCHFSII
jgi:hypothetical protein